MPRLLIYTLLLVLISLIGCQTNYTVEEQRTADILFKLSTDELKGRQAFTPEIKVAEQIIADEFELAKLAVMQGMESYKQAFFVIESEIESESLTINGSEIPDSDFLTFTSNEYVAVSTSDLSFYTIEEGDNFRSKFLEYRESESDAIIFVDPSFSDLFQRYDSYYSRPNRYLESESKANVAFVLGDYTEPNIELEINSTLDKKELNNVIGYIEGNRKDEFVIFSAHHDHLGVRSPVLADSIANGANDNGSGVTAVIQLAHHFAAEPKPERSLIFVTFTAEEMGGYGSQYFSDQLNPDQIVAMFNIEMIGKPAVSGPNTAWITGYDRSTFGELLSKSVEGTDYEFYADPYPNQDLFYRSDNATLARLGVPAHSISTTPIDVDRDYHQVSDEFETINISHLNNTIKAIAAGAKGIISGDQTPTRVDASKLD